MTVAELFEYVDEILENPFSDNIKRRWLNQIEAEIQVDVLLLAPDGIVKYSADDNGSELIAPAPYDELYSEYLFWRICLAQHENELADNYAATFNRLYNEYVRFVCETINPGCGMAERVRYYLTAYQIAVKHGYAGTEAEWVDSLEGPEGKPGAGLHILGHVDAETDLPMDPEQGDGYLVGADNLLYIWDGDAWFFKLPLRGEKGDPGKTPQKGVDYWTPEEEAEITAAKNAANTAAGNADSAAGVAQTAAASAETAAGNANNAASAANTEAENARAAATVAADAAGNAQTVADEVRQAKENGEFKGDPFTYSDFTPEQLEALRGPSGTMSFSGAYSLPEGSDPTIEESVFSTESHRKYFLGIPKGATGDRGERGSAYHLYRGAWYDQSSGTIEDGYGNYYEYIGRVKCANIIAQSQWNDLNVGDFVLFGSYFGTRPEDGYLYPIVYIDPAGAAAYLGNGVNLNGEPGKNGSDAEVTAENIRNALGYTPANENQGAENAGKILGIGDDGKVVPVDAPNAENAVVTVEELPEATEESPDLVYLLNDETGGESGGITEETDPTVPDWAKQPSKPDYTASEVGAIPAPATAEVGQVMRVAAVDENGKPTEWEPYKEPDYELIETIVMEEAAVLIRRKEPDGKDYAFSALFFHIKVPIGQTISSGSFMFHKKIAGTGVEKYFAHRWTAEVKGDATKPLAYAGRVYREKGMWCWYLPSDFKVDAGSPIVYDEVRADITDITEDGTISYIYFSHTFPAGTEIKIYGVRA